MADRIVLATFLLLSPAAACHVCFDVCFVAVAVPVLRKTAVAVGAPLLLRPRLCHGQGLAELLLSVLFGGESMRCRIRLRQRAATAASPPSSPHATAAQELSSLLYAASDEGLEAKEEAVPGQGAPCEAWHVYAAVSEVLLNMACARRPPEAAAEVKGIQEEAVLKAATAGQPQEEAWIEACKYAKQEWLKGAKGDPSLMSSSVFTGMIDTSLASAAFLLGQ